MRESNILDDIRVTPCSKMSLLEAVHAYGVSQYRVQPSSSNLSLVTAIGIIEKERRTTYTQLDQQDKARTTKP
jgi:hypothetical protein